MPVRALLVALMVFSAPAFAGPPPEAKCEMAQHLVAARHAACRHKAERKAIKKDVAPDYAKCDARFEKKWAKASAAAAKKGASCPYDQDGVALQGFVEDHIDTLTSAFDGTGLPTCGDDAQNLPGEQCDGTDLGGASCESLGFASGALACDVSCVFDSDACVSACLGSSTNCSGSCAQLDSDNLNCGTCGIPCAPGTRCESGTCS